MGFSNDDISRLLAGQVPSDDPELGGVSAFLDRTRTALPPVSPPACTDRHLAVVTREARLAVAARAQDRQDTVPDRVRIRVRRALVAAGTSILVALTAGVGVAAAMGVNPLQLVPGLVVGHPVTPGTGEPNAEPEGTAGPADGTGWGSPHTPAVDPTVGTPSPTEGRPKGTPSASAKKSEKANNGHSGEGNSGNGSGNGGGDGSNGKGNGADGNNGVGNAGDGNNAKPKAGDGEVTAAPAG